jgi:hypothetical protein
MVIEYSPHAAQMEIHRARGLRFRTVCTGRRIEDPFLIWHLWRTNSSRFKSA